MAGRDIAGNDCEFCRIVAHIEQAEIVYESADALAFFPLNPAALGHTLVIPRKHVANLWRLDAAIAAPLFDATLLVAKALESALSPDGLNLINSVGEAASQTVLHLHIHLVPRWQDDHFGNIWPPSKPLDKTIESGLAEVVRDGIRRVSESGHQKETRH